MLPRCASGIPSASTFLAASIAQVFSSASVMTYPSGVPGFHSAATDDVMITASSCEPACSNAEVRRVFVPPIAGITTVSHVLRAKFTGEAT